jgi:hypothetical protein
VKQPALGITASFLVIAVSLGFIALFTFPTFANWVAFLTICFIPMQIVISVTWGGKHPAFAAARPQPAKGILLTVLALAVGAVVAVVHLIKNPVAAGFTMLVACYLINYLLFRLLFNYGFMRGAPVYVSSLDPHGLFNAWSVLVFYITVIAVMFLSLNFDLWPFTKFPALMRQPLLGLVWTITSLVIGGLTFYIGVHLMKMDVVSFMVRVPIPFVFGTIIVLNMMHGSIFGKLAQPLKGLLNAIASAAIGTVLALLYGALAPLVTGKVNPGPPSYDFEIWLASALLAVTFPFLICYAEFFKMWPLHRESRQSPLPPSQ